MALPANHILLDGTYYKNYHLYTRRITPRDAGKTILCVRAKRIGEYCDQKYLGKEFIVVGVDDWAITVDGGVIPAEYNKSHWVVTDELPADIGPYKSRINPETYTYRMQFADMCGDFQDPQCEWCLRQNARKKCGRCRAMHYCSVECQRDDWLSHKKDCKKLVAVHSMVYDDTVPSGHVNIDLAKEFHGSNMANAPNAPKFTIKPMAINFLRVSDFGVHSSFPPYAY